MRGQGNFGSHVQAGGARLEGEEIGKVPQGSSERVALEYEYQKLPNKVVVWSDTDPAGCGRTRRSTSGGVVLFGSHCLKTFSQTQETIALSFAESEFYRIVKAATMGIGIKNMFKDLE